MFNHKVNKEKYNTFENFIFVSKHVLKTQKALIIIIPIYILSQVAFPFTASVALQSIIDQLINNANWQSILLTLLIYLTVLIIVKGIMSYAPNQIWWRLIKTRIKAINEVNKKTLTMDYQFTESPEILDSQERASNATDGNSNGIEGLVYTSMNFLKSVLIIIISSSIIFTINPLLIVSTIIISLLCFININKTKKQDKAQCWDKMPPLWRKENYIDHITNDFNYSKDIRLYKLKNFILAKHKNVHDDLHNFFCEHKDRWKNSEIYVLILNVIQDTIFYSILIYSVLMQDITIGMFTLYLTTIKMFSANLNDMLSLIADAKNQSREINDYRKYIELENKQKDFGDKLPNTDSYKFEFKNVSFKYPLENSFTLKNINLIINNKEKLAVVGLNGAGKTTLIKLLCRLYDVTEGEILLNGINIQQYDKDEYYSLFSPVFQDFALFALSLTENITMQHHTEIDEELALIAAKKAGLGIKIENLNKGMDSQISRVIYEDGVILSGGEQQKIALARAIYKDSPIIVLDEPTAALDAAAEYNLYTDINHVFKDKLVLFISHRLSSTRFCDRIILINEGEIIQSGTHHELINTKGEYQRIFNRQAQYYQNLDVVNEEWK